MTTQTVMIYDQFGVEPLQFLVLNGDYTHLDQVFINSTECTDEQMDELSSLIYDGDGNVIAKFKKKFPRKAVVNGAKVIVAGFLP
ncbi:hypothetical protein [Achromobacter phage Motura]|uniref:Uncharacterized protein n=1 Tax=Achromobacter phage Motura TaxID=2591403 RepID=A0A514CSD5_9CAUD|nr:hypothetical protein H1O15_gp077 [Achromobacter phage Motura]QDH83386.1 hypothetical protein [Achromobacter phage Motura]